jgi:hypothetical protein
MAGLFLVGSLLIICLFHGIQGRADKLAQMFDFFREKGWCEEMEWERQWI